MSNNTNEHSICHLIRFPAVHGVNRSCTMHHLNLMFNLQMSGTKTEESHIVTVSVGQCWKRQQSESTWHRGKYILHYRFKVHTTNRNLKDSTVNAAEQILNMSVESKLYWDLCKYLKKCSLKAVITSTPVNHAVHLQRLQCPLKGLHLRNIVLYWDISHCYRAVSVILCVAYAITRQRWTCPNNVDVMIHARV